MPRSRPRRTHSSATSHRYPRSARVNEMLREVLAEALERLEDTDERLGLLTITAVQCEEDLRHALVLFSSMSETEEEALSEIRIRLQAAVSRQARLKRTPQLRFAADPAVAAGQKIEDILRTIPPPPPSSPDSDSPPSSPDSDSSLDSDPLPDEKPEPSGG